MLTKALTHVRFSYKKIIMDIGKKIKLLRGNMTQAELANASGIDKAIISKIENGHMSGTLESHQKIAKVFGLKLSEFYAYLEDQENDPAEFHSASSKTDTYQDFLEIITNIPLAKKMLPVLISIKPKEEKILEETVKNAERFIYILEGQVEILIETKTYKLKKLPQNEKGDSLYSLSNKTHKITNTGINLARLLCISAPPIL